MYIHKDVHTCMTLKGVEWGGSALYKVYTLGVMFPYDVSKECTNILASSST